MPLHLHTIHQPVMRGFRPRPPEGLRAPPPGVVNRRDVRTPRQVFGRIGSQTAPRTRTSSPAIATKRDPLVNARRAGEIPRAAAAKWKSGTKSGGFEGGRVEVAQGSAHVTFGDFGIGIYGLESSGGSLDAMRKNEGS